jgi:hypothetical protein
VLLLDDVFSELDEGRCSALTSCLPPGQTLLTVAGEAPEGLAIAARARVVDGAIFPVAANEVSGSDEGGSRAASPQAGPDIP